MPPPAGSILVIPAGSPARWRWSGRMETLIDFLEPRLVARVAAEAFDLDPARTMVRSGGYTSRKAYLRAG